MRPKIKAKDAIKYADGMKIRSLIEDNFKVTGAFSGSEKDPHGNGQWSTIRLSNGIVIRYTAPWFTVDESQEIRDGHIGANHGPAAPGRRGT